MKKIIYIAFIFVYFLFLPASCYKGNNRNDPYPDIKIPIYGGARKIKYFYDMSIYVKSVDYTLKVDYPATEIINFYNKKFDELKFEDYSKCNGKTNWDIFRSAMKSDYPFTRRFAKCWLDRKKEVEIFLELRYGTDSPDKWTNKLSVFCQIEPFIDDKAIEEFFNKLEKEGKYGDFMSLLKKYSTSDQNVNFKKAIEENPKNQDLIEYYNLVKTYRVELEKFKFLHKK